MKKSFKLLSLAAMFTLGLSLFGCSSNQIEDNTNDNSNPYDAYVLIDINPSFSFFIDENNIVSDISALNEDGDILLLNIEVNGNNLEQFTNKVIEKAVELGYIDAASGVTINIDAASDSNEVSNSVKQLIMNRFQEELNNASISATIQQRLYDNAFINAASEYELTPLEYRLALRAYELDTDLTFEDAIEMAKNQSANIILHIKENTELNGEILNSLKESMLLAKEEIIDEYVPLIEAKEAQIQATINADEDTSVLETELQSLKDDMAQELETIRNQFIIQNANALLLLQNEYQERIDQFKDQINDILDRFN